MTNGLFITLFNKEDLKLYLKNGLYGFLFKPLFKAKPDPKSSYFKVLADYACGREGTEIFFFLKRHIYYGGKVTGNKDVASFYLNGTTSPLGRDNKAELFWDESRRYTSTSKTGVFAFKEIEKSQPFIIKFKTNENTGKYIESDVFYFELGNYRFPLPSNSLRDMSLCTLTPGETNICLDLISKSENKVDYSDAEDLLDKGKTQILFSKNMVDISDFVSESELEFDLTANLEFIKNCIDNSKNYVLCRQVPISPFKPQQTDRADICLYDIDDLIKKGMIPNVIIELKQGRANSEAYEQVSRYLKWLRKILSDDEYKKINCFIVAKSFCIELESIREFYSDKIKLYSLETNSFVEIKQSAN